MDLLGEASKAMDEAEQSLADAPGAEEAAARTAARRQAVAEATARAKRTAGLLEALERARDARAGTLGGAFDTGSAARDYEKALSGYGLDVASRPEAESAEAIRRAPPGVRLALILALDDWAGCVRSRDRAAADRLGRIADLADDDKWRRAFRAAAGGDVVALKKLAEEAPGRRLPAATLDQLGRDLYNLGARPEATALLRAVRRQYPSDFWAYLDLTLCLQDPNKPDLKTLDEAEACGCAAVALRPRSSAAHHRLGCVLYVRQDLAGAVAHFQEAIRLDPLSARAVNDLAVELYAQQDLAATEENIRRAVELDPKLAVLHKHLGVVLRDERKLEESADEFRRAVEMDPKPADAHYDLGVTLLYQGRFDAAMLRLQRADLLAADLARDAPLRSTVQVELRECDRLLTLDDELDSVLTGASAGRRRRAARAGEGVHVPAAATPPPALLPRRLRRRPRVGRRPQGGPPLQRRQLCGPRRLRPGRGRRRARRVGPRRLAPAGAGLAAGRPRPAGQATEGGRRRRPVRGRPQAALLAGGPRAGRAARRGGAGQAPGRRARGVAQALERRAGYSR